MKPMGNYVMLCPHCGHRCYSINSDQITATYREIRFACSNGECGHIFVGALTPVRTLVPSAQPNPEIVIPLGRTCAGRAEPADPPNPNQLDMFGQPEPAKEGTTA